jgi:hypothetical protein
MWLPLCFYYNILLLESSTQCALPSDWEGWREACQNIPVALQHQSFKCSRNYTAEHKYFCLNIKRVISWSLSRASLHEILPWRLSIIFFRELLNYLCLSVCISVGTLYLNFMLVGLILNSSWSVSTMKIGRWTRIGQQVSKYLWMQHHSWLIVGKTKRHTNPFTWRTCANLVETPSRLLFQLAAV